MKKDHLNLNFGHVISLIDVYSVGVFLIAISVNIKGGPSIIVPRREVVPSSSRRRVRFDLVTIFRS